MQSSRIWDFNQPSSLEKPLAIILQQAAANNGWNMPLTGFLLLCEFDKLEQMLLVVFWNNVIIYRNRVWVPFWVPLS